MLTQSWYDSTTGEEGNDDVVKGVWSPDGAQLLESPLPLPSGRKMEEGEEGEGVKGGGGEGVKGVEEGGPLVPALLSKLERVLDQVSNMNDRGFF